MLIIINSLFISIGIPVLSNNILAVDVSKQHCSGCPGKDCSHCVDVKQCLEYQCFTVCEPRTADNSTYYVLNANNIFLMKNGYHRFFLKVRNGIAVTVLVVANRRFFLK